MKYVLALTLPMTATSALAHYGPDATSLLAHPPASWPVVAALGVILAALALALRLRPS